MSKITLAPNASGTGTLTVAAPNTNSDYTLTLPAETGTVLTSASSIPTSQLSGTVVGNGPAFRATLSSTQTLATTVTTKVQLNSEDFDTANCYDTSTYRFTPNVAGYYQVNMNIQIGQSNFTGAIVGRVYKNGSDVRVVETATVSTTSAYPNVAGSFMIYMNGSTDYLELYAYQNSGGNRTIYGTIYSEFSAFLARAA